MSRKMIVERIKAIITDPRSKQFANKLLEGAVWGAGREVGAKLIDRSESNQSPQPDINSSQHSEYPYHPVKGYNPQDFLKRKPSKKS